MLPFSECGTGDTVLVFLHFFGSSRREWEQVIEHLSPTHRCVAADMAGFGDAAGMRGFSVTQMAAQICLLVEHWSPVPVVLIAHSFSGKAAMVLSASPPANLQGLILVAPSPLVAEPISDADRKKMRTRNQTREGAEAFIAGSHHRELSPELLEVAIEDVLRANEDAWFAWPDLGSLEDWSSRVTELRVPATLIVGDLDEAVPLAFQRQHTLPLVEKTGGKLIVIKDAAHMLPNEAPEELARVIAASLHGSPVAAERTR